MPGNEPGLLWLHRLLKPIRKLIYLKSRAVVANSEGLKKVAKKSDPIDIQVIPQSIFYNPLPQKIYLHCTINTNTMSHT